MALDADEEILQDFLVEAGEILEKLSEQLVDLEQHPDDSDLLNAIFRGFHTVKGGAGFLVILDRIVKLVFYYFHERVWFTSNFGVVKKN